MPIPMQFRERLFPALPQLVSKFGSPFHIYHEAGIRQSIHRLDSAFKSNDIVHRNFYAVKALPRPAIMKIIADEGGGFDCSSIPELRLARNAGAKPEDIMFTSNDTSAEEFREALAHGGCILNLDDITFIDKIPTPFPELICFRLNPGKHKTGDDVNSIIGEPIEAKYGVPIENIVDAYEAASARGARRFGLHTMVCSNDLDYRHMVTTLKLLLEVATKLMRELGIKLEFINMGGGIGIPYRPEDHPFDVAALGGECRILLNEFASRLGYAPKLFTECGRYITGPHGVLVNEVINTYTKYKPFIGVQVAMPALMRVGIYKSAYHQCYILDKNGVPREGPFISQTIAGPICENCDRLANNMPLPIAHVGDFALTADTGAHGAAMAFQYNGRPRPPEFLWDLEDVVSLICRGETYDDLDIRHRNLKGEENRLDLALLRV